jgi:hypothetical protein
VSSSLPVELFELFTKPLTDHGIAHAITGSVAGSAYGDPRMTNDIDIVVDASAPMAQRFLLGFPQQEFYVPPVEVIQVELMRAQRAHFNIIHHDTGFKADIYPAGQDPLQQWAIQHRRMLTIGTTPLALAPVEYVIVKKLEFHREGGSHKHIDDITAILRHQRDHLDAALIERHARQRGVEQTWLALWQAS